MTNDAAPQCLSVGTWTLLPSWGHNHSFEGQQSRMLQASFAPRHYTHVLYKTILKFLFAKADLSLGLSFNQF